MTDFKMNPALHTLWQHRVNGEKKSYRVIGIWGTGARERYQVVSYELSPVAGGKILLVPVEKMREIIKNETLKPI